MVQPTSNRDSISSSSDLSEVSRSTDKEHPPPLKEQTQQLLSTPSSSTPLSKAKATLDAPALSRSERFSAAVSRFFSFFKRSTPEEQRIHAREWVQRHNNDWEGGFQRTPEYKQWKRLDSTQEALTYCKLRCQFALFHECTKWHAIKRAAERGNFQPLADALNSGDYGGIRLPDNAKINESLEAWNDMLSAFRTGARRDSDRESTHVDAILPSGRPTYLMLAPTPLPPPPRGAESIPALYTPSTLLAPQRQVRTFADGQIAMDLGCTKTADDTCFADKTPYCEDHVAVTTFDGGVAMSGTDGVSKTNSELAAQFVSANLNDRLAAFADTFRELYRIGREESIAELVREQFIQVQEELVATFGERELGEAATTAVAFVKIDMGEGQPPLVVGGSIGDCCAACTTVDTKGQPSTKILNPEALSVEMRKSPPGFRFHPND